MDLCFNSYSPTLSHTYTQVNFHQFTTPEAPPCAAPLAGCPAASAGYTLGPGSASDSPKSLRTTHTYLTGQRPGEESNSKFRGPVSQKCAGFNYNVHTAPLQPLLLPFSGQLLTRFHTDPVRLAIRVTGIFFPFELCSRMKNMCQLCCCSCLYVLLPLLAHGQLRWAPPACRHLMQMGSRVQQPKLWLPTRGLLKNKSIL